MEFKYPFPSLQQLSILRICQQLADLRRGPFRRFTNEHTLFNISETDTLRDRVKYVLLSLDVTPPLKSDVWDILIGTYYQVRCWVMSQWNRDNFRDVAELEFHFDPFGRFDGALTWRRYFERKVAKTNNGHVLIHLLNRAAKSALLYEVDLVLRKLVDIGGFDVGELERVEPQHQLLNCQLVLIYRLVSGSCRRQTRFEFTSVSVICDGETLRLILHATDVNFQSFCKHFHHLEPSERDTFFAECICALMLNLHCSRDLLDALNFINSTFQQSWLSYLENHNILSLASSCILDRFLIWPFTMFFIPVLKLVSPILSERRYALLLREVINEVLNNAPFSANYRKLLLEFWAAVPVCTKRLLRNFRYTQRIRDNFQNAVGKLRRGNGTISIYNLIRNDLSSIPDEENAIVE